MPLGKVKWFNNAKGYGFIIANDDEANLKDEDLFAHFSSIQMEGYKTLKAGQAVSFDVVPSGKGYHAVNIQPLDMLSSPQSISTDSTTEESELSPSPVTAVKEPSFGEEIEEPGMPRQVLTAHA